MQQAERFASRASDGVTIRGPFSTSPRERVLYPILYQIASQRSANRRKSLSVKYTPLGSNQ